MFDRSQISLWSIAKHLIGKVKKGLELNIKIEFI